MAKSFKVTGKITVADGATNNTTFGTATPKQTLSIAEVTFDFQVERQQTRIEDAQGSLEAGDTYISFSALRLGFKCKRTSLGAFLSFLMGTAGSVVETVYTPITMGVGTAKNRVGAAKIALYHPILGASVPAIKTPADGVLLYQALAPEGALTGGVESEAEFAFLMDIPSGQSLLVHNDLLTEIAALT